jgi:hypothetical protein
MLLVLRQEKLGLVVNRMIVLFVRFFGLIINFQYVWIGTQ